MFKDKYGKDLCEYDNGSDRYCQQIDEEAFLPDTMHTHEPIYMIRSEKIRSLILVIRRIIISSSFVCVIASTLIFAGVLFPHHVIQSWGQTFASSLESRRTLLAQSRLTTFELARIKPSDEASRIGLVSRLQKLNAAQHTTVPAALPTSSMWTSIIIHGEKRNNMNNVITGATAAINRHQAFLTEHDTWLYDLEHTSGNSLKTFITSSSSVAHITELTNIVLQYKFWIDRTNL